MGMGSGGISGMIGQGDGYSDIVVGMDSGGHKGHDRPRRWVLGHCRGDGVRGA